jgi:calcineurin-like phosphoesterase family protein
MKVNIVLGNHCTERGVTARDYLNAGDNISLYAIVSYHGFWLSHAPIHPQEMRNRKGNIHGHLHSTVVKDQYGHVDNKYRCVSMEHIQYTPMNFQDIKAEFNLEAK